MKPSGGFSPSLASFLMRVPEMKSNSLCLSQGGNKELIVHEITSALTIPGVGYWFLDNFSFCMTAPSNMANRVYLREIIVATTVLTASLTSS